jgi:ATP-dependent DNA ligase
MPRVERICLLTKPARSRPESRAALPRWVKPQLCQLVKTAPDGPEWLHEIKFDRYRMHARIDRGRAELLTRTGLDWTGKYPAAAAALAALPAKTVYLDGELCGVRPDGTTSFDMIQVASEQGNAAALVFFAFDLLFLDGEDLTVAIKTMPLAAPPPKTSHFGTPLRLSRMHWVRPELVVPVSSSPGPIRGYCAR